MGVSGKERRVKDFIIGFFIGCIIVLFLYPYFCLMWVKNIPEEIEKLRETIEKVWTKRSEDD